MSAFILGNEHINWLVNGLFLNRKLNESINILDDDSHKLLTIKNNQAGWDKIGQILVSTNHFSILNRYPQDTQGAFPYQYKHHQLSNHCWSDNLIATILKATDSYDYQTCEFDNYSISIASQAVDAIRNNLIQSLLSYKKIPTPPLTETLLNQLTMCFFLAYRQRHAEDTCLYNVTGSEKMRITFDNEGINTVGQLLHNVFNIDALTTAESLNTSHFNLIKWHDLEFILTTLKAITYYLIQPEHRVSKLSWQEKGLVSVIHRKLINLLRNTILNDDSTGWAICNEDTATLKQQLI